MSPSISALILFVGIILIWLAIKGRIRPIFDAIGSGQVQK